MSGEREESGVHIDRRTMLWLPVAAAGGLLLRGAPVHAEDAEEAVDRVAADGAFAPLSRDAFGERWLALAADLRLAPPDADESYAAQLAGLIARVPIAELPELETPRTRMPGLTGGPSWFLMPCLTVEFRMEPGAELRLHNHPPQVVVTLCAEGEADYRHFEIDGDAPPCTQVGGMFRAREVRRGVLLPGRTTALTRARDGIHGFTCRDRAARLIDFTLGLTADFETFSYLALSDEPVDVKRRVYDARWTGKE